MQMLTKWIAARGCAFSLVAGAQAQDIAAAAGAHRFLEGLAELEDLVGVA